MSIINCKACRRELFIWPMPETSLPEHFTVSARIVVCNFCANIMAQSDDNAVRVLTPDERRRIRPGCDAVDRDSRHEQVKQIHDEICRRIYERGNAMAGMLYMDDDGNISAL